MSLAPLAQLMRAVLEGGASAPPGFYFESSKMTADIGVKLSVPYFGKVESCTVEFLENGVLVT